MCLWVVNYVLLNVLKSCDLGAHSITLAQKCQHPADKIFQDLTTQNYQSFL